jgi:diguanylate cyclase (GGDEF)-like protein
VVRIQTPYNRQDWIVATPGLKGAAGPAARAALIDAIFNSTASIVLGGISCTLIGLATAYRCGSMIALVITLLYTVVVTGRVGLNIIYHRRGSADRDKDRWARRYAALAVLSAAMLGTASGTAIALDLPTALLVALSAIGSGGGIAGRNAGLPRIAMTQCVVLIAPMAIAGFWSAEPVNMLLAPTGIGYCAALLSFVRHQYGESSALIVARLDDAALARNDMLTGIANRRAFEEQLTALWPQGRDPERLALLMIDIDYFKRYNDLYGHPAGDDCLRRIAPALRDVIGEKDIVARYGGEEFAVLLPDCGLDQAIVIANRLRHAVLDLDIEQAMRGDEFDVITISIGIGLSEVASSPEQLVEMADRALYRAKREGRNRTYPDNAETVVALQGRRTGGRATRR